MISADDFVLFCHRTLDGYDRALTRLDDATVNAAPPTEGSTPFQLIVHATAAYRWWTARHVCARPVARDRDAEFEATGSVASAAAHVADLRALIDELAPELATATTVHFDPTTQTPLGADWTVGACLIHAYEELAQHLGHLEITVDLVAPG